jgi:hypothetical protein
MKKGQLVIEKDTGKIGLVLKLAKPTEFFPHVQALIRFDDGLDVWALEEQLRVLES